MCVNYSSIPSRLTPYQSQGQWGLNELHHEQTILRRQISDKIIFIFTLREIFSMIIHNWCIELCDEFGIKLLKERSRVLLIFNGRGSKPKDNLCMI